MVEHHLARGPDGDLRLGGISLALCREVIDVPPPLAVQISEHRIFKGWCALCQKWHEARVDLHAEVLGHGRIGVRLTSMIAYLRTSLRLPIRQIREVLHTLHGVQVSVGEIVEVRTSRMPNRCWMLS
jgi:transposase